MYLGKIVEYSKTDELFETPLHPYTEVLLASVPEIRVGEEGVPRRLVLKGDVPSPVNIRPDALSIRSVRRGSNPAIRSFLFYASTRGGSSPAISGTPTEAEQGVVSI